MPDDIKIISKWSCPTETGVPLLTMPNVPRPLHGLPPRKIMGDATWTHVRKRCYFNAGYKCEICGAEPSKGQLHAHELYTIDWKAGTSKFERCIAICRQDHDFIHSGRLVTLYKEGNLLYPKSYVLSTVEKGFKLIHDWNKAHPDEEPLRAYITFLEYMKVPDLAMEMAELIEKYKIKFYAEPKRIAKWEDWKLLFGNKEYPTPYANQGEWKEAMVEASKKDNIRAAFNPFGGEEFEAFNKISKA